MSVYGFSGKDVGRIRRTVKKVERAEKSVNGGANTYRVASTLQKCKTGPGALKLNASSVLELYDGPPGREQPVGVLKVYYRLGSADIPAGKWVFCIDGEVIAAQC